jgi:MFS family permease
MSTVPETKDVDARPGWLGLPANVIWLSVVSFLNDFSSEMIYPLLPLFFRFTLHASVPALGVMEGIAESTASIVKLGSGWLGDRIPRRKPLVVIGYGLASAARPFIAAAHLPWQVVLIRFADRLGKGIRGAPRDALIADSVPSSARGRAFGLHRSFDHTGAIVGPAAAAAILLLAPGSYRLVFACAAVPALASVVALALFVRETRVERAGQAVRLADARQFGGSFWYLMATIFLFTLGNSSDAFLLLRARDLGVADVWIPALWMLLHLIKAGCSTPAGILSDRVPRRWLVITGWLTYAAVYAGFAAAARAWEVWALFAGYGVYFGLVEGVERALVADLVPQRARGTAFGWYNLAVGVGALPASVAAGFLWRSYGPSTALGFGAAMAIGAAALLAVGGRRVGGRGPERTGRLVN